VEDPLLGRIFAGRYQVNNLVAAGGMGRVYRAQQRGLERWVALKVLHRNRSSDEAVAKRFYTEMRAMARVEHPYTVRVYDFGHASDGALFVVMELIGGRTLSEVIDEQAPLTPSRVAAIGARIARGLAAAHAMGVVHRDLKPDNVLLTDSYGPVDWVKVLDFGLARVESDMDQDVTGVGVRVGTPLYMAPEYIEHRVVDARSDLYALGAVLYELATGRVPYEGTARQILQQQVVHKPTPPSEVASGVPAWLDTLILECMALNPDHRPPSAAAVARRLEGWAAVPPRAGVRRDTGQVGELLREVKRSGRTVSQVRVFVVATVVAVAVTAAAVLGVGLALGVLVWWSSTP